MQAGTARHYVSATSAGLTIGGGFRAAPISLVTDSLPTLDFPF